jgi:mRNA-degrading endonuclease toxin of MazEF toxin-antitoxin module
VTGQKRPALRGEIWFTHLSTDPQGKAPRPVVIVSSDYRNRSERANTVLVVPLTTSIHREAITQVFLAAGETGLQADSGARAENVTVVNKTELVEPRSALRQLSHARICELADQVRLAMGCPPLPDSR